MNINILSSIRNLSFQDLDHIDTPIFTIDSRPSVRGNIIDENCKRNLGVKALQSFANNIFSYKVIPVNDGVKDMSGTELLNHETYTTDGHIKTFLQFLWFIKDNSVSIDDTYGYESDTFQYICIPNHTINSNSTCGFDNVVFSAEEINRATNILLKYIDIFPSKTMQEEAIDFFKGIRNIPGQDIFKSGINDNTEANNIQRAMNFLNTARSVPYLPYKIALYMPLLESLFCHNDFNKITQKVSERVAFYIGKNDDERKDIIKTVREAYAIRSRFLHGGKLDSNKSKPDYLKLLSVKIDKIIRKILTKVIMEDSKDFLQKEPNEFLNSLTAK